MPALVLEWDSSGVVGFTEGKVGRAALRAASKAGGDAIRSMKTESARTVRQRKRVKAGKVKAGLVLDFPHGKSAEDLVWRIDVSGATTPVIDFPAHQVRAGVMAGINTGKSKLIPGAFIATMRSGHRGVFERAKGGAVSALRPTKKGKGGGRVHRVARLPIHELFTTRIADVFNNPGMVPAILEVGRLKFESSFARLLPLELDKIESAGRAGVAAPSGWR